jgi:hypothetical protein
MTSQNTSDTGGFVPTFVPTMTDLAGHDLIIVLFLQAETKVERVMGIEPTSLYGLLIFVGQV